METSKPEGKRRMKEIGKEEQGEEEVAATGEDSKRKRAALTVSQKKVTTVAAAAAGSTIQPSCQVEDCRADLKDAKPYHRRHKVCEHHSKAPLVLIDGLRQRFCQQCSRFHDISEFDDTKRSCRRRLAGHNERRRKSTYDSNGDG